MNILRILTPIYKEPTVIIALIAGICSIISPLLIKLVKKKEFQNNNGSDYTKYYRRKKE